MSEIKSVTVTVSHTYSPQGYLDYCEDYEETPTQEGFEDYLVSFIEDDFGYPDNYEIKRIGE